MVRYIAAATFTCYTPPNITIRTTISKEAMPVYSIDELFTKSKPKRQVHCPSALGPLSKLDTILLAPGDDGLTRVGFIRKLAKYNQIPASERPLFEAEKVEENKDDNGGHFMLVFWAWVVSEYDWLENMIKESNWDGPRTHLERMSGQEVVLSNSTDWMPVCDVDDVGEIHYWGEIEKGLLDIEGRAQSFWCRYVYNQYLTSVRNYSDRVIYISRHHSNLRRQYPAAIQPGASCYTSASARDCCVCSRFVALCAESTLCSAKGIFLREVGTQVSYKCFGCGNPTTTGLTVPNVTILWCK